MTTVWWDDRSLSVNREDLTKERLDIMPPETEARVESILREARYEVIVFNIGTGPFNVTVRDLEAITYSLDMSGNLWRSRPAPPATAGVRDYPAEGQWPCQHRPAIRPIRLVAFLYVLLRDGASAPGDVEQHAINAGRSPEGTVFTNPHVQAYAESLAGYLLEDSDA